MTKKSDRATITLINKAIKSNLATQNWENLEGNLYVGLRYSASEGLRIKAGLTLGKHHAEQGHYLQSISAYEHARILSHDKKQVIANELAVLSALLDKYESKLTHDDLMILRVIVELILRSIHIKKIPKFPVPGKFPPEFDIPSRIKKLLPQAPKKPESVITYQILQIFNAFDPSLTPDQRFDRVAKILAPHILKKIIKIRRENGNNHTQNTELPNKHSTPKKSQ